MKVYFTHRVLLALLFLIVASCRKDSGVEEEHEFQPLQAERGGALGSPVVKVIGSAGGQIATPDGKIQVDVPAGAVANDVQFTIQPITKTLETATGSAYRLGPEDVIFEKDVKISFAYTEEDLIGSSEDYLYLTYQDKAGYFYQEAMTEIDQTNHKLWVNTRHFSDWYLNRIFSVETVKNKLVANEETDLLLFYTESWPDGRVGTAEALKITTDTWFVNGPGNVERLGNVGASLSTVKARYKAPASIIQPTTIAVGAQVRNMVSKTHPDRPGTSGLVIAQREIELVPDEYFIWQLDGAMHTGISLDANFLGGSTILLGTGLTGGLNISLNATQTGEYELGNPAVPDHFSIVAYLASGTETMYQGSYYLCDDSKVHYGKGKLKIDQYGSIGGIISGSIEATVYSIGCDPKAKKQVKGRFRIRRKV